MKVAFEEVVTVVRVDGGEWFDTHLETAVVVVGCDGRGGVVSSLWW